MIYVKEIIRAATLVVITWWCNVLLTCWNDPLFWKWMSAKYCNTEFDKMLDIDFICNGIYTLVVCRQLFRVDLVRIVGEFAHRVWEQKKNYDILKSFGNKSDNLNWETQSKSDLKYQFVSVWKKDKWVLFVDVVCVVRKDELAFDRISKL